MNPNLAQELWLTSETAGLPETSIRVECLEGPGHLLSFFVVFISAPLSSQHVGLGFRVPRNYPNPSQ